MKTKLFAVVAIMLMLTGCANEKGTAIENSVEVDKQIIELQAPQIDETAFWIMKIYSQV